MRMSDNSGWQKQRLKILQNFKGKQKLNTEIQK